MSAVVVGFVPTPEGRAALRRSVDEARLRTARLVVVTSRVGGREYGEEAAAADREALAKVEADLQAAGQEHEIHYLVRGREPASDVLDVAAETDAALVVIGVRRRTPVGKLLMGSNAQRILLEADVPVLAVKADE